MMPLKHFAALSILAILAACAPVEQKPLITAPIEVTPKAEQPDAVTPEAVIPDAMTPEADTTEDIITQKRQADDTVEDPNRAEDMVADKVPSHNTEITAASHDDGPKDALIDASQDNSSATSAPLTIDAPQEAPAPPPPYDPAGLIGQTQMQLQALFGKADLTFDNGSLRISHYRQESCVLMVFSQNTDEGLITHIDMRAPRLGTMLDEAACHNALGAKKQQHP